MPVLTKPVTLSSICLSLKPMAHCQLDLPQNSPRRSYRLMTPASPCHTLSTLVVSSSLFRDRRRLIPYLANTLGSTPSASRSIIGTWGLFFFIVGYALIRNDLSFDQRSGLQPVHFIKRTHRTAALGSEVWQKWKRTSFSDFVKAYLLDMASPLNHGRFNY